MSIDRSSDTQANTALSDVVIGVLAGIDNQGVPLVVFPNSLSEIAIAARSTVLLTADDIGREVALLFESGDAARPLIIGRIQGRVTAAQPAPQQLPLNVEMDGESISLSAKKDITLRCGKASITLTKAGKILIRGSYLLSRSSGANRIKGGSVQLN